MADDQGLLAEIEAHPKSALIEALADAMHEIEDDDCNGRHVDYYRSLAYATVEILPGLDYDEDATCDEPGCGAHPPVAAAPQARAAGWVPLDEVLDALRDHEGFVNWTRTNGPEGFLQDYVGRDDRDACARYLADRFGVKENSDG